MSQYQKHQRNATTSDFGFLLWGGLCLFLALTVALIRPALTAAQTPEEGAGHLFLLPLGDTSVELLTHIVDVRVGVDETRELRMEITADYRLLNPARNGIRLLFQVNSAPGPSDGGTPAAPQAISLAVDGQALPLEATGNGLQRTAQLDFGPDQRRTLRLGYTLLFPADNDLASFAYPASALDSWPGRVGSWRVTLHLTNSGGGLFSPDNWLAAEPDGWTFTGNRLQWLSEESFPERPLRWQVLHPALWQEIESHQQAIRQQPSAADFQALGDLYRRLYEKRAPQAVSEDNQRERFYALALSAYTEGLRFADQTGLPSASVALLHLALAALYRSRSIGPDGGVDPAYVALMVDEAETALALLPPESGNARAEVTGWLVDGLRLQTRQAQQRREWATALGLLDRLAALPDSPVDGAQLAEERRLLLLEQSLQLMAQGNPSGAQTVAGETLAGADLLPPPERQAIFAHWDFTLYLRPTGAALQGRGQVVAGREAAAQQLVEQLSQAWEGARPGLDATSVVLDGRTVTILLPELPLAERLGLIQATPQNSHWALLRTLLVNSDVEVERASHLIWQRTTLRYAIDLRAVADQWSGIGASLEREVLTPTPSDAAEERIVGELRAIHYRQEAEAWQKLIRNSRVQVALLPSPGRDATPGRLWSAQLTDPPQPLRQMSESISFLRLFVAVALAMAALFLLAGILWLLL